MLTLCSTLVVTLAPGQIRQHRNSIFGVVLDAESSSPLVNVNVFLSNTKIGTGTDARGAFTLTGIPSGRYDLVFSRVGYERVIRPVLLNADTPIIINAQLKPRVITIPGVDVLGEGSGNAWERKRNMRVFLEEFLGKTNNASRCKVLNQDMIRLWIDYSEKLNAAIDSAIIVENRALGYRISVELISFTYDIKLKGVKLFYYPRFEDIAPADSQEAHRWEVNRAKSYLGSRRHFFRSLFYRSLTRDKYFVTSGRGVDLVNRPGYTVTDSLHLSFSRDSMTCVLTMDAPSYNAESYRVDFRAGYPRSRLDDFNSSVFEARQSQIRVVYGELDDPRSIAVYGRWARERVADELPLEYVARE
jgi:hypothetical protein